jgi:tetratricopeptide (TPR) repeat protein
LSSNPEQSRLAKAARLARQAEAAAASGRLAEAVGVLKDALRLDPGDRRALHRLGELHVKLKRPLEAAGCFAAKARCEEREGFETRAIASWRLAVRLDPAMLEGYERIGALYVSLGLLADARLHYEKSAQALAAAGHKDEAAILRAHLAAIEAPPVPVRARAPAPDPKPVAPPPAAPRAPEPPPTAPEDAEPDDTAAAFAADRMQSAGLFHHYGLHAQAREQLEDLLKSLPEHLKGRQLLVEVCRALGDDEAAAQHLRIVTHLMRRQGEAKAPEPEEPVGLPPFEEWAVDEPQDPMAALLEEIRQDVERALDRITRREGGR